MFDNSFSEEIFPYIQPKPPLASSYDDQKELLEVICSSPHPKQGLPLSSPSFSYTPTPTLSCSSRAGPEAGLWWAQGHGGSQVGFIVVLQQVKLIIVLAFASSVQPC